MIRPARPEDLPRLRAQLQALADHDGASAPVASEAALAAALFGARPLIHAVTAEAGMAFYYPDFSTHRGEPGVYVQDLYVSPSARGSGLARALLASVLLHQDWQARFITLGVSPGNAAALRFYGKTGFTPRGYQMMILQGDAFEALTQKAPR